MRILHVTTLVVCLAATGGDAQHRPPATPAAVAEQAARLSGADAAARALAACHLGEMGLDALPALTALTQLLADATPVMPVICGRETLPSFTSLPEGTTTPGYQAARALVLLGNDGHDALVRAASSSQPAIRRHAVRGLLRVRDRGVAEILLVALNDADPAVRADAARGLGRNRNWW